MQWEFIIALVIAIPLVLIPAGVVWSIKTSSLYNRFKETKLKQSGGHRLP